MQVVGMVVLFIVLPFIPPGASKLPSFLRWFDNADGDGLDGDGAHQVRLEETMFGTTFLKRYWWLAVRNPINYFQHHILGVKGLKMLDTQKTLKPLDAPAVPSWIQVGDYSCGGVVKSAMIVRNKIIGHFVADEYYIVQPYKLFGKKLCLRIRIGHKLTGNYKSNMKPWTFNFHPFKTYRGV